jgi:putative addiction module component (TIGR02574 family)
MVKATINLSIDPRLRRPAMPPTFESLGIDQMSPLDRIALVQEILDSLVAEQVQPLSTAKREELARRLSAHITDPADVVPWEHIESEALARFQQ